MPEYATNYIAAAIKAGLSARRGLDAFRSAGGRIGNESWFGAYREALASFAKRAGLAASDYAASPPADLQSRFPGYTGSRYLYQFDVAFRFVGSQVVDTRDFTVASEDILTIDDAMASALDTLAEAADRYGDTPLAIIPTAVFFPGTR